MSIRQLALSTIIALGLCLSAWAREAGVDKQLTAWRTELERVRHLAEYDVPRAYEEARQLQASLPANITPADQIRALNVLARAESYFAEVDDADRHAQQALELAKAHDDRIGRTEAHLTIAFNSVNEGRIDKVRQSAIGALNLLDATNQPDLMAEAMLRSVGVFMRHDQASAAASMAMRSFEIAQGTGSLRAKLLSTYAMALVYEQTGQTAKSNEYYEQMLELARDTNNRLFKALALNGLANTTNQQDKQQNPMEIQEQAVAVARKLGAPFMIAHTLFGQSHLQRLQGQYAEAIATLAEPLAILQQRDNKIGQWWVYNALAGDYLALGQLDAAATAAKTAYTQAEQINFPLYLAESGKRLAAIAAARGQHKQAYAYRVDADVMAKRAEQDKLSELLLDVVARYQGEAKQRQIDELRRREVDQVVNMRLLWGFFVISLGILALVSFLLIRLRASQSLIRRINADLEQRIQIRTDELRRKARYLRTLIDTLPLRVWMKDTQGHYLAINSPEATIEGRKPDEMIGKTDLELWPGPLGEAHATGDEAVMATRQATKLQSVWQQEGKAIWMEIEKAPVFDEDGSLLGTVGVARDISAQRAAEALREAALADAKRLAQMRGDFLAQMSHELRTPLNGILGHTQILRSSIDKKTPHRSAIDIIHASGEHLLTLIEDILDLARIESGKLELVPDDIPLPEFLQVVGDIIAVRARQKGLGFSCTASDHLPTHVVTDGKRLRQVLLNLLSNAVKFTVKGQVTLTVNAPLPGRLRFEVRDTGIGIPEDKLDKIFEPFVQAGDARQRRGGTGLGLSISQQLVQLMGGKISAESRPGVGSRFIFEIDAPECAGTIHIDTESWCKAPDLPPLFPSTSLITTAGKALTVPASKDMTILHRLARLGNMRDILEQIDRIDDLDPAHRAFTLHMRELAENFQSKALLAFIESHLHDPDR